MRYTEAVLVIRILADVVLTYMLLHFLSFAEVQCFHSHFSYSYGMCLQFSSSSGICCCRPLLSTSDAWMRLIWWFKRLGLTCKMCVYMFTDVISLNYFTSCKFWCIIYKRVREVYMSSLRPVYPPIKTLYQTWSNPFSFLTFSIYMILHKYITIVNPSSIFIELLHNIY